MRTLVGAVHNCPAIHSLWVNGVGVNARLSITGGNCHWKLTPSPLILVYVISIIKQGYVFLKCDFLMDQASWSIFIFLH